MIGRSVERNYFVKGCRQDGRGVCLRIYVSYGLTHTYRAAVSFCSGISALSCGRISGCHLAIGYGLFRRVRSGSICSGEERGSIGV